MKSKYQKKQEAQQRQAAYADSSIEEKITRIQQRGHGVSDEVKRLLLRNLLAKRIGPEALKRLYPDLAE